MSKALGSLVLILSMVLGTLALSTNPVKAVPYTIGVDQYGFHPNDVTVTDGETVTLVFENWDTFSNPHRIKLVEYGWESAIFDMGESVSYTFVATVDSVFKCSLGCTGHKNLQNGQLIVQAPPSPTQYQLTIGVIGSGTTDPPPGDYMYDEGTEVTVAAIPDSGWMLDHWELNGVNVGSADTYTVTMDSDYTLTAVFVETPQEPTYIEVKLARSKIQVAWHRGSLGDTQTFTATAKNIGNATAYVQVVYEVYDKATEAKVGEVSSAVESVDPDTIIIKGFSANYTPSSQGAFYVIGTLYYGNSPTDLSNTDGSKKVGFRVA